MDHISICASVLKRNSGIIFKRMDTREEKWTVYNSVERRKGKWDSVNYTKRWSPSEDCAVNLMRVKCHSVLGSQVEFRQEPFTILKYNFSTY